MKKSTDLRHGRTCVFEMHVHLVFVTKYRRKVFTRQVMRELKLIFSSVCRDFESILVEFDGEGDHVHLLINYPGLTREDFTLHPSARINSPASSWLATDAA